MNASRLANACQQERLCGPEQRPDDLGHPVTYPQLPVVDRSPPTSTTVTDYASDPEVMTGKS